MSIHYQLTAYCSNCGWDIAESDDEDLDTLAQSIEHRSDVLYREHKCRA